MKNLKPTVLLQWNGDEPISAKICRGEAKVLFEKGDVKEAHYDKAMALIGHYKKFQMIDRDEVADDKPVEKLTKKTKKGQTEEKKL